MTALLLLMLAVGGWHLRLLVRGSAWVKNPYIKKCFLEPTAPKATRGDVQASLVVTLDRAGNEGFTSQRLKRWLLFTSTVLKAGASGQNRFGTHALRSHRRSLIRFRCSNSCFLLETGIAVHERLSLAKWHPEAEKKLRKRPFFDTANRHEKLYGRSRLYASAQWRHETGGILSLFSSLSFDISIKNSAQRWSSDFQGLFRVKMRKIAQGSNDLSTLPLSPFLAKANWVKPSNQNSFIFFFSDRCDLTAGSDEKKHSDPAVTSHLSEKKKEIVLIWWNGPDRNEFSIWTEWVNPYIKTAST